MLRTPELLFNTDLPNLDSCRNLRDSVNAFIILYDISSPFNEIQIHTNTEDEVHQNRNNLNNSQSNCAESQ